MGNKRARVIVLVGLTALGFAVARANAKQRGKTCPAPSISQVKWSFEDQEAGNQPTRGNFWVSYDAHGQTGEVTLANVENSGGNGYKDFIFPTRKATTLVSSNDLGFDNGVATLVRIGVYLKCGSSAKVSLHIKPPRNGRSFFDPAQGSWCADYEIIDSRGSGEPQSQASPPGAKFIDWFEYINVDDQTRVGVEYNPYPAAGSVASMLIAWAKLPHGAYHSSVVAGKRWLTKTLHQAASECPDTPIYLVGYSQGAQVTADVYQSDNWPLVQGVALFGDPYFNPADSVDRGSFSRGLHGVLGRRPSFRAAKGTVLSYCHRFDPVCQAPEDLITLKQHGTTPHKNYDSLGDPSEAVKAANYFGHTG